MKKYIRSLLHRVKRHFTYTLDSKIDKLTMLNADLLSQQHLQAYKQELMGGGGEYRIYGVQCVFPKWRRWNLTFSH